MPPASSLPLLRPVRVLVPHAERTVTVTKNNVAPAPDPRCELTMARVWPLARSGSIVHEVHDRLSRQKDADIRHAASQASSRE
jgi:hypothetical protein